MLAPCTKLETSCLMICSLKKIVLTLNLSFMQTSWSQYETFCLTTYAIKLFYEYEELVFQTLFSVYF